MIELSALEKLYNTHLTLFTLASAIQENFGDARDEMVPVSLRFPIGKFSSPYQSVGSQEAYQVEVPLHF